MVTAIAPAPATIAAPTTVTPATTAASVTTAAPQAQPEPDLITKVTQFKGNQTPTAENLTDINFDFKELESIKDPAQKEIMMKAYKSMQRGATMVVQEAAKAKREAEDLRKSIEGNQLKPWTKQRIQAELLSNPEFLQVAATMQNPSGSGLTDEQYSALSDTEKAELNTIKQQMFDLQQENLNTVISQEDTRLKTMYADYDVVQINDALANMVKLKPHQIREFIYKAVNHERHYKSAYELGVQDGQNKTKEKIGAISTVNGVQITSGDNQITREKNERPEQFFVRLAQKNLENHKNSKK